MNLHLAIRFGVYSALAKIAGATLGVALIVGLLFVGCLTGCGSPVSTDELGRIDPPTDSATESRLSVDAPEESAIDPSDAVIAEVDTIDAAQESAVFDGGSCGVPWDEIGTCTNRETNGWCLGDQKILWSNCCTPPASTCAPYVGPKSTPVVGAWCCPG